MTLKGIVRDSITHEALPFVTIIFNDNPSAGMSCDSTGHFVIKPQKPVTSLTFTYVGYVKKQILVRQGDYLRDLTVQLSPVQQQLKNVTVVAGENPANRIIRMAVKNRDQNNYAMLPSYTYKAYEKFLVSGTPTSKADSGTFKGKLFDYLGGHYILILESVIQRQHLGDELNKETVLAQKVSGLNNPNFTLLASELQSTSFYQPFIYITNTGFVNPISPNSWNVYFFNIEDTLFQGKDTVYVISYHPDKGHHFASLKGQLEINTDGYAIQHVTAEPADTSLATVDSKIEQRYTKIDSVHWFPSQLNSRITFKKFVFNGLKLTIEGSSHITDPVINPPLSKKDFDGVEIEMKSDATRKSDEYWQQNRLDSLSPKEQLTYAKLDSLNREHHLDAKFNFLNALQDGNLRFPYVDAEINNIIRFNHIEGARIGLGLVTNRQFSNQYQLEGFAGYGIKDGNWKYGGFGLIRINEAKNVTLKLSYSRSYEEDGGTQFFQSGYWGDFSNYRNYTITNFDYVTRTQLAFTSRIRKYLNMQITGFSKEEKPIFPYQFLNTNVEEPVLMDHFHFSGAQVAFRFSYKERVVQSLDHYYWVNEGYPTVWFQVTQGFKGLLDGDFDYTKYEAKFNYIFPTRSLGQTSITLQGGFVQGSIPSAELFSGVSSYAALGLFATNSFQTMRSGEFLSDRYIYLFLEQDFLNNIVQWGKFQPNLILCFNAGFGALDHPEYHIGPIFKTMDKGYYEGGFLLNNLVARKFLGVVRVGVGAGVFYRFGPYAFPNGWDNVSVKADWTYNFK